MGPSSGGSRWVRRAATWWAIAVAVPALCVASGCSSGNPSAHAGTVVRVTERDFHIAVSPTRLPAGNVVLTVHNRGPEDHELIVVRDSSTLPLRADGITINEEALDKVTAGGLEPGAPGSTRELHLDLKPGRYQLFCNMSGHYFGGMHTALVVT